LILTEVKSGQAARLAKAGFGFALARQRLAKRSCRAAESVRFLFLLNSSSTKPHRLLPSARWAWHAGQVSGIVRTHVAQSEDVAMERSHYSVQPTEKHFELDLDQLLHPAQAFEDPKQVVEDPDLTLNEKRAILASWASDACAVEATPALRHPPGVLRAITIDDVLEALRTLDRQAKPDAACVGWARRQERRRSFQEFRKRCTRKDEDPGQTLSG
jgi:hypothetical protein